jgi:hypothetical protein
MEAKDSQRKEPQMNANERKWGVGSPVERPGKPRMGAIDWFVPDAHPNALICVLCGALHC